MAVIRKIPLMNREISWLHFNGRVLQEAADIRNPLIERLRFLGIFSNNRDEFFRVRVATLNRMLSVEPEHKTSLINPSNILKEISGIVQSQEKVFIEIFWGIVKELKSQNIFIINEKDLTEEQGVYVKKYFLEKVRVFLFPIMINNLQDISSLHDRSIYLAVQLISSTDLRKEDYALIELPTKSISRFLLLPTEDDKKFVILLDDIIRYCLSDVFSIFGWDTYSAFTVKVTRDAEIDIDTDVSKSFLEIMTQSLKQRKRGNPVRFVYDSSIPEDLLRTITKKLDLRKDDPIRGGGRYHNFKDFMFFPNLGSKELEFEPLPPLLHKDLPVNKSILSSIREKDIMLHYPYHSFQYIIDLLREVSIDPNVRSIKMTIYRAARNSSVINSLINAARNGKYVTVFMELQARFDEEANIYWTQKLQDEGVKVMQGIPGFKVHGKLILIRRKESGKNVYYANICTGNFNEDTARVYADDSLLTANEKITTDVVTVFHQMETNYRPMKYKNLVVAPYNMRDYFLRQISIEIKNAKAGKEAWIIIKVNNLVDEIIIKKLYKASQEGVKIKVIVRGICILIPGIPGWSENIEAISIVDRFLEHSRIFIFCSGGNNKYFITSADWMIRNFDNRIEVACPVYDKNIQNEIKAMIDLQLNDNVKARLIGQGESNQYLLNKNKKKVRSQIDTYQYLKETTS